MTIIPEEERAAVQERFPEGSLIRTPSGERGTLNFIDAGGRLHVDLKSGGSLTLTPDADGLRMTPPDTAKMSDLKLYMPISASLRLPEEEGVLPEEPLEIPQYRLKDYQTEIAEAMARITHPAEVDRGLMHWYCDSDGVNRKVHSVKFRPERRGNAVWCVADCKLRSKLSSAEMNRLKGFIELHAATSWNDLLERNPVQSGGGTLTVQVWQKDGWSVRTEEERFGAGIGGKVSGLINRRFKTAGRRER